MPHKGLIIGLESMVSLMIITAFIMLSVSRASSTYGYGFRSLNDSFASIVQSLSEQRTIYSEYYSGTDITSFMRLSTAEGYSVSNLNGSNYRGPGRIVAVGGKLYVLAVK